MVKLQNLPYNENFYWKGKRYVQFVKLKNPRCRKSTVVCRLASDMFSDCIDMPSGRMVKEIIRIGNE